VFRCFIYVFKPAPRLLCLGDPGGSCGCPPNALRVVVRHRAEPHASGQPPAQAVSGRARRPPRPAFSARPLLRWTR